MIILRLAAEQAVALQPGENLDFDFIQCWFSDTFSFISASRGLLLYNFVSAQIADQSIMSQKNYSASNLFDVSADYFIRDQLKKSCLVNGRREILAVADYWATLDPE